MAKAKAAVNLFGSAKEVVKTTTVVGKSTKAKVHVKGLDEYAALDVVEKTVKALKDSTRASLESQGRALFVEEGSRTRKRPDSFRGYDGDSEASIELRRKASNQPLSEEALTALSAESIPTTEVVDQIETFIINPERLEWLMTNSAKVSAALTKVPGFPEDLFMRQSSTVKHVASDDTLAAVFTKDRETVERLLPYVTNFAVKVTTKIDVVTALNNLVGMFTADTNEEAEAA